MGEDVEDLTSEDLSESTIAVLCFLGRCMVSLLERWF